MLTTIGIIAGIISIIGIIYLLVDENISQGLICYLVWDIIVTVGCITTTVLLCGARSNKDSIESREKYISACKVGIIVTLLAFPLSLATAFLLVIEIRQIYSDFFSLIDSSNSFSKSITRGDLTRILLQEIISTLVSIFLWCLWMRSAKGYKKEFEDYKQNMTNL